jgi:uncharacterized LabA/DUF88 family protein
MDRCALFVDAGYLLAEGGKLCCGTKKRNSVACDYDRIVSALAKLATENCTLPVLRVYWYDGAREAIPTLDHLAIAELANVKLRLGRLSGGKQKGVDALIFRDLMTLARERAVATAFLFAGDEDLREGVVAAQDMGVRVVVVGVESTEDGNQSEALVRESDQRIELSADYLKAYISRTGSAQASSTISIPHAAPTPQTTPQQLGGRFGGEWVSRATDDELRELFEQRPRIPKELDVELIVSAEADLGSLRDRPSIKPDLRAGFWKVVTEAGDKLDSV